MPDVLRVGKYVQIQSTECKMSFFWSLIPVCVGNRLIIKIATVFLNTDQCTEGFAWVIPFHPHRGSETGPLGFTLTL